LEQVKAPCVKRSYEDFIPGAEDEIMAVVQDSLRNWSPWLGSHLLTYVSGELTIPAVLILKARKHFGDACS